MDQNYLDILEESLVKKNQILDELKTLSEGQYECITDESSLLESLDPFIEKKGKLIEELEVLDTGFESLYEKVSQELKENREKYSEQIKRMQQLITKITEKSTAIQAQEERNKNLIDNYFGRRRTEVREGRINSRAAMNYYKVQSNSAFTDSQFWDSKK